jgi:hypothetical protein
MENNLMSTSLIIEPKAVEVKIIENHAIWTLLEDGREIIVPIAWYPRLSRATSQELNNLRIIGRGSGIHWEDLDEDLSIRGFILGFKGVDSPLPKQIQNNT